MTDLGATGAGDRVRPRRRTLVMLTVGLVVALVASAVGWHHHERQRWQAAHTPTRTEARAGDPDIPAIDWPNGPPDDGRWTDDPWVATLREYVLVDAVAYNTGDMVGSTDLYRLVAAHIIEATQEQVTAGRTVAADATSSSYADGSPYFPGPWTLTVLDVQGSEQDAVVRACVTSGINTGPTGRSSSLMASTSGTIYEFRLALGHGDSRTVTALGRTSDRCEVEDVHYGLFDPQPERVTPTPTPSGGAS
jgi:hypothetical protein